ncbi:MAG: HlyD family efflux transporter periplasmic adaptor subunit [Flavobacteriales bacterium]|nr:HlyD family efflux transporter periplasmic adaptor subunit [Flavobacteriales bacterium]MCB9166851.1 HlyD family efflux transporter periplasmic adaptor subunit [Flavobacteriales bacterium]
MIHRSSARLALFTLIVTACNSPAVEEGASASRTPVTITHVVRSDIAAHVRLNAVVRFLRRNTVTSPVTGRITKAYVQLGGHVQAGSPLYDLRTREADALRAAQRPDSLFRLAGDLTVRAPSDGVVVRMDKLTDDLVTEGDALLVLADASGRVFMLEVPFERSRQVIPGTMCSITLPDSSVVEGTIGAPLSTMEGPAQTRSFPVRPRVQRDLPEGLIGTVLLPVQAHRDAQVVPAACVLSNEEMTRWWVMRMVDDSTAVKVPITTGIEAGDSVEVVAPEFGPDDRLVLTGAYGLGDTARVQVQAARP